MGVALTKLSWVFVYLFMSVAIQFFFMRVLGKITLFGFGIMSSFQICLPVGSTSWTFLQKETMTLGPSILHSCYPHDGFFDGPLISKFSYNSQGKNYHMLCTGPPSSTSSRRCTNKRGIISKKCGGIHVSNKHITPAIFTFQNGISSVTMFFSQIHLKNLASS